MTAIAAIAKALLDGKVLTIKTAFKDFGVTNLPRECGRGIERKFGVQLAKIRKEGVTRYKIPCSWFEYRLPTTEYNAEGRIKMEEYVKKHMPSVHSTTLEAKTETQTNKLF